MDQAALSPWEGCSITAVPILGMSFTLLFVVPVLNLLCLYPTHRICCARADRYGYRLWRAVFWHGAMHRLSPYTRLLPLEMVCTTAQALAEGSKGF